MKGIFLLLTVALAALLSHDSGPARAASLTDAHALARIAAASTIQAGGCLDEGCEVDESYRHPRAHVYDETEADDDDGVEIVEEERGWRERAYSYAAPRRYWRGGGDDCWSCSRRCGDGYCPSECWGWRKHCRRERY